MKRERGLAEKVLATWFALTMVGFVIGVAAVALWGNPVLVHASFVSLGCMVLWGCLLVIWWVWVGDL